MALQTKDIEGNRKFAERLQLAMDYRGIKAAELSRRTDLSKASITEYRKALYWPSWDSTCSMADVLRVEPLWLLGYDDEHVPDFLEGTLIKKVAISAEDVHKYGLNKIYEELSPDSRKKLIDYAEMLKAVETNGK